MCAGRFLQAEKVLRPLTQARAEVAHAARITLGAALRQDHRHADAEIFDAAAFDDARSDADRTDALVSLAADAVGRFDPAASGRRLDDAARSLPADDRRLSIRLGWVRTEHALLTSDARAAVSYARTALAEARALGWPRHIAKSALFCGTALHVADAVEAERILREAAERADAIGAIPIAAAAREVLARRSAAGR